MEKITQITGLDIGSSKVSAVAAEMGEGNLFRIRAEVTQPSRGIVRGVFTDLDEATEAVARTLAKLREKTGRKSGDVVVNVSGPSIRGEAATGMVPLTVRGREVTDADMARAVDAASTITLPSDREVLHRVVRSFSIDERTWTPHPAGLYASRLYASVFIITAGSSPLQNIQKCVMDAGYGVREVVFSGLADGIALLDAAERADGSIVIDIGASVTEIAFFTGGSIAALDVIEAGGTDIGSAFKTSPALDAIIVRLQDRLREQPAGRSPTVALTGGFAFTDGIVEFLEERLGVPVRVGLARDMRGDISSLEGMRFSTAIGLARFAHEKRVADMASAGRGIARLGRALTDLFNSYF